MTKIISRTAESKKAMTVLGEVSNKLHQTLKDGGLETLEEEYNYVGKTHDELIQSGSEEALQKNIATEIKAGKDPKQAAAIAYSIQRENDAEEIPHITKEQWNKIPNDYKTTDPATGKKQAFAGSLGIAPGGTTLLTEGKHFIIDADIEDSLHNVYDIEYLNQHSVVEHWKTYAETEQEAVKNFENKFARMGLSKTSILNIVQTNKIEDAEEKNYTYIMFGTTGKKRVDNLTKAEAEHLLKNNKLLGYDGKVVETKELGDDITTQQYFTDISDKFDLSKYTNDPETVETQSGGTSIIELSEDDEYNVKLVEALKKAGYRKVASYKFVKDTDCNIKDAYYNIGGYKSETDNMLKQDISKARSYGLKTYVEKVDGSYQLTVEGSRDKVEKIVEDYFAGDVSSIGDKQVFSEETMNSVQEGIEKDYENMNKDLEELHDTSAPKEIEDIPLKARQEMKNAKEKSSKLLEILSQLQDIVNKASAEEKAEVKYKAEKILADLKKQFGLEKETYIKLDSAIKDGTTYGITPLFKWKKGNKKPERVEYSLESARYVKNSLERNDRIPYVIFELDTYRIVDSIQDDDKEKIKLKNELETLKSELKSNNRKYWKISEINEKEDRIVELERRIAELES